MESAKTDVQPGRKTDKTVQLEPAPSNTQPNIPGKPVIEIDHVDFHYGASKALHGIKFSIPEKKVTALIGPSGCGKSTLLRCLNRMNDLIPGARLGGRIEYHGEDLYHPRVSQIEVGRGIGMVFQKANPFPKSIYDNVAFGPRVNGFPRGELSGIVEQSLARAALWDEVKDKLRDSALSL